MGTIKKNLIVEDILTRIECDKGLDNEFYKAIIVFANAIIGGLDE